MNERHFLDPHLNNRKIFDYSQLSGVRLPHSVLMNRLQWQWEIFPFSSTEQVGVFKTALTFVDSISEIWSPLLCSKYNV